MADNKLPQPILKWAGGKRQLLDKIRSKIPGEVNRYYEPFIGGGALLFDYLPTRATINDYNNELVNVYLVIKENPNGLIEILEEHQKQHNKEYYYAIRNFDRDENKFAELSKVEKAARTIYLNKTCYNGLFRVSSKGYFNTPIGRYVNPKIADKENITSISRYFNENKIKILCGDFKTALETAKQGDFVYLDPPYQPMSKSSSFTEYTDVGFSFDDQVRLKKECDKLTRKGVKFLLSNSDSPIMHDLYNEYKKDIIPVKRFINCNCEKRTSITEILISNY